MVIEISSESLTDRRYREMPESRGSVTDMMDMNRTFMAAVALILIVFMLLLVILQVL